MDGRILRSGVRLLAPIIVLWLASWSIAQDHKARQPRPIRLGVSGINIEEVCSAGTLGSLVKKIGKRRKFILSNNHVLARQNDGEKRELIIQPGSLDDDCQFDPEDGVARLKKFIPIDFSLFGSNEVDAAIAKVKRGKVDKKGRILGIGRVSRVPLEPQIAVKVKKAGRTTELTNGTIDAIDVTVVVQYPKGLAWFVNQFTITPGTFSAPGDSGSLIVTDEETCPHPVGLLFAGSEASTVANPIRRVYQELRVESVGCREPIALEPPEGEVVQRHEAIAQAMEVKGRNEKQLLSLPGVVGVGIGSAEGEVVIKVFLEEMTLELERELPTMLEGFKVVPEVTGKFIAY